MRHSKPNKGGRGLHYRQRCMVCGAVVSKARRVKISYQDEYEYNPSGGWVIGYLCPLHYKPVHQAIRRAAQPLTRR